MLLWKGGVSNRGGVSRMGVSKRGRLEKEHFEIFETAVLFETFTPTYSIFDSMHVCHMHSRLNVHHGRHMHFRLNAQLPEFQKRIDPWDPNI